MDYIYYSLYLFYTRVIFVQRYYPPVINIAAVIAFLETSFFFAFVNSYLFLVKGERGTYSHFIPFFVSLVLYWYNEKHFSKHEKEIIGRIGSKGKLTKLLIVLISWFLMGFVVWLWMFDGLIQLLCFCFSMQNCDNLY